MKYGWVVLLLLTGFVQPGAAKGQAAVYGEVSASQLTNLVRTDYAYGGTAGFLVYGPKLLHHVVLAGDLQGRFVHAKSESLNGISAGPRFEVPTRFHGLAPYGEILFGFARLRSDGTTTGFNGTTTDATIQLNGGVSKQLSPHWDATAEYSYAQYYALGGEYNPKTYSVGAVYHFDKR